MRHRALILAAMLLAAPALAGDLPAGGAGGRYVIGPARDGFVRLDTATGAASHCAVTDGAWRCEPLPGDDAALKTRVDALSADVARLTAAVSALDARLANLPAVKPPPAEPAPPSLARQLVDRLLDVVRRLKHAGGAEPSTPAAS